MKHRPSRTLNVAALSFLAVVWICFWIGDPPQKWSWVLLGAITGGFFVAYAAMYLDDDYSPPKQ